MSGGAEAGDATTVALTYKEIASRLRLHLPAAKARVKRRGWKRIEPNDQRQPVRFLVPVTALDSEKPGPEDDEGEAAGDDEPGGLVAVLRDHLARVEARIERQTKEHADEVARLREDHAAALDRARRDHEIEVSRLREDRDREVARLAALVDRLATPPAGFIERVLSALRGRR